MSKYTTEVRFICETASKVQGSTGYTSINEVIRQSAPVIFDFDFPIFDEAYRSVLCHKILKHYYTREICEETVGLWKLRLDTRMNEIMPYFNQLYKSELIEFNPMYDIDYTRTGNKENNARNTENLDSTNTGTSSGSSSSTGKVTSSDTVTETNEGSYNVTNSGNSTLTLNTTDETTNTNTANSESTDNRTEYDLYSDTPQGALTNVDSETYLTNARKKIGDETRTDSGTSSGTSTMSRSGTEQTATSGTNNSTSSSEANRATESETDNTNSTSSTYDNSNTVKSTQENTAESTEEYLEKVSGKQGGPSYSKLLMEYRKTFLNIDMQVIDSLSDLFFGLW